MDKPQQVWKIFISYRRAESRWLARSLYDRLVTRFGNQVFMDIFDIPLADNFVETIERTVGECDVLIAIIGDRWLTLTDEQGRRRLDNPEDSVRMEIATALKRNILVIPVLVDGANMRASELPDDLKALVHRNALSVGEAHFDDDYGKLVAVIEKVLVPPKIDVAIYTIICVILGGLFALGVIFHIWSDSFETWSAFSS